MARPTGWCSAPVAAGGNTPWPTPITTTTPSGRHPVLPRPWCGLVPATLTPNYPRSPSMSSGTRIRTTD